MDPLVWRRSVLCECNSLVLNTSACFELAIRKKSQKVLFKHHMLRKVERTTTARFFTILSIKIVKNSNKSAIHAQVENRPKITVAVRLQKSTTACKVDIRCKCIAYKQLYNYLQAELWIPQVERKWLHHCCAIFQVFLIYIKGYWCLLYKHPSSDQECRQNIDQSNW